MLFVDEEKGRNIQYTKRSDDQKWIDGEQIVQVGKLSEGASQDQAIEHLYFVDI